MLPDRPGQGKYSWPVRQGTKRQRGYGKGTDHGDSNYESFAIGTLHSCPESDESLNDENKNS